MRERKRLLELHGNIGRSGSSLLANHQEDAASALKILIPHGKSLTEAAEYFETHFLRFKSTKTFKQHFDDLILKLERKQRSKKTILQVKDRTKAFLNEFGSTMPRELADERFVSWFWRKKREFNWSERTCHHTRSKCSQLMLHVMRNDGMSKNPCDLLDLPDVPEKEVAIYSIQEVSALLYHSIKYDLQNYFALGFFAGLRPEREGLHLKREDFFLETKQIFVPERLGKSRSRSVDIQPVLMKWLTKYLPNENPVTDATNFVKRRRSVFRDAGITLIHDGIRHTYGSMLLAETGNKQYVIDQMGHRGNDDVFDNHYKRLVKRSTAENFFELTPRMIELLMTSDMKDMFWKDLLGDGDKKGWRIKEANLDNF
jgi:integrase